jgi:hypothetical protein
MVARLSVMPHKALACLLGVGMIMIVIRLILSSL